MPSLAPDRQKAYLDDLKTLLSIPSVSTDPARKGEVRRCAEEVARQMSEAGLKGVEVIDTPGHPVVFGQYLVDPALPTALIYGHYDVQPARSAVRRTHSSVHQDPGNWRAGRQDP